MRNLWISRSNNPHTLSLSELLLSLFTGIEMNIRRSCIDCSLQVFRTDSCELTLQYSIGYGYILSQQAFIILVGLLKCLILFRIFRGKSREVQKQKQKSLSRRNLMYPGMARAGTYLLLIILVSGGRSTNMSIVVGSTLIFIGWLHLCSNDNKLAKRVKKGRNYSSSPIKVSLLYVIVLIAIILQPSLYNFAYKLHFQIFVIFMAFLLIFSYFYLHRVVLTFANRDKSYRLLAWQSLFQVFTLLVVQFYFFFMAQDMEIVNQFIFIKDNWWVVIIFTVVNTGYEMILWEHIRKVALTQLALTLATGFIWFNIYQMIIIQIEVRLYISVILMIAVLLVNVGLFSKTNLKRMHRWISDGKKKGKNRRKKDPMFEQYD